MPRVQSPAAVRFDWGLPGAQATGQPGGALVIVDVLSFSTAVAIATGRGAAVYPHAWPSPGIEAFAAARNAALALPRGEASPSRPWSLSPASLLRAPIPRRLVLPSPNGSALAAAVARGSVLAGSLRNASAVARWLEQHDYATPYRPVAIIAAGERWPSGDLRPALEDLLGAGAIIAAFAPDRDRSPEALAAEAVWRACRQEAREFLRDCQSGRELVAAGYAADIMLAAEHDSQTTVPLLTGTAFREAV